MTTAILISLSSAAMADPDLSEYEIAFSDEFSGAELDPSKWSTAPLWGPYLQTNMEEQFYVDTLGINEGHEFNPFTFTGSTLKISSEPVGIAGAIPAQPAESDPVWSGYPEYNYATSFEPDNFNYLSGLISSVNSYNFTHGYIETRAKVPSGRGLWPAFWLLTSKYVEDVPEIDVMEYIGQFPNEVNHTLHYFDVENNWSLISSPTFKTTGPDYSEDFHTYGLMWTPTEIIWYVDGVETKRITDEEFLIAKQSMYIISNLAVGGSWPGSPDSTTPFPAEYEIDYIRAYKKIPPEVVTPETLSTDYQLMFSDEFEGNTLDANKWLTHYLWGPYYQINNEEQIYIDSLDRHADFSVDPFLVSDGTLKITAEEILASDLPVQPEPGHLDWLLHPEQQYNAGYGIDWVPGYSSGVLTSYDNFKFVNGYVEVRAKLPEGDGLWPAFWLLNGYYVGNIPEIDIMEMQGEASHSIHQTYHYFDANGNLISSPEVIRKTEGDYSDGEFHTFGVQWQPGSIQWYIDGELTRTLVSDAVSTQLMYIIVNLAVGGNFVGAVDTVFPKTVEIDYIRAYQLNPFSTDTLPMSKMLGETNLGVPVLDTATGVGYIMHSDNILSDRFSDQPPLSLSASNLIAVQYQQGKWYYNNNWSWIQFDVDSKDVLLAEVDFDAHTITSLEGQDYKVGGMEAGYIQGDLEFFADQLGGVANFGEYDITGTNFIAHAGSNSTEADTGEYEFIGDINMGLAVLDSASGIGYVLHSQTAVSDRFSLKPPLAGTASNLVAVQFMQGRWYYNNNWAWYPYTVESTDRLLAEINFDSNTITSLSGQNTNINGLEAGFLEGDLEFIANQLAGQPNQGEYDLTGSGYVANPDGSGSTGGISGQESIGDINAGLAVLDTAQGIGYVMHSTMVLSERFSAHPPLGSAASNLIAVRYQQGQWFYNNNWSWYAFDVEPSDLLLAKIDFDAHTIENLVEQEFKVAGMEAGYLNGNLQFFPDQLNGLSNTGEYDLTGSWIVRREGGNSENEEAGSFQSVGDLKAGIPVQDDAVGVGYVMHSMTAFNDRFSDRPPLAGSATNLVAVQYLNNQWYYNNNWNWYPFTAEPTDELLAIINFDQSTINSLVGLDYVVEGISAGYAEGDLTFYADQLGGRFNADEYDVSGTRFQRN